MFVERNTQYVKQGCMDEAIQLFLSYKSWWTDRKIPVRYYTPVFGPLSVLVFEVEYESIAAYEKLEKELVSSPEFAELSPKWLELTERGGTTEGWIVEKV